MEMNGTQQGERCHIALFGKRNAGKSSLMNAILGQELAIVSEIKGTTTDPVSKAMELLPLGACMITDTPGLDDEGELGKKRVEKAEQILHRTDLVLLVVDGQTLTTDTVTQKRGLGDEESVFLMQLEEKKIPYIIVVNQCDKMEQTKVEELRRTLGMKNAQSTVVMVSTVTKKGIEELKNAIGRQAPAKDNRLHIVDDLVKKGDIVVLVVPIDESAPKGRLIMPQQQLIRDILDNGAVAVVTQIEELEDTLEMLRGKVNLVITDSQAFGKVAPIVPKEIKLTSFSILLGRYKGDLETLVQGIHAIRTLKNQSRVLIAEGCTHRRQCNDIGTVKIPRWLKEHTKKELVIETSSGMDFPTDLTPYELVIHCGGCTLHEKEMKHRMYLSREQGVPMVNYGLFIAYVNGILERSVEVFPDIYNKLK